MDNNPNNRPNVNNGQPNGIPQQPNNFQQNNFNQNGAQNSYNQQPQNFQNNNLNQQQFNQNQPRFVNQQQNPNNRPVLRPKKNKTASRIKWFLIAAVVVVLGVLGWSSIQQKNYETALTPVDVKNTNYIKADFTSGSTVSTFAITLKNKDLIRDSKAFVKYFVGKGDTGVQAGEYYIQKSMSVSDIYNLLKSGPNVTVAHQQFIQSRVEYAQEMQKKYGIFTSINIAQTILESEWGQSTLASKYNNYYGIKAIGSQKSVTLSTKEYLNGSWTTVKAKFAVYDDWKKGLEAHTKFLINGTTSNPDQFADVKASKTYQAQAHALVIDGYATDPTYEDKLLQLIKTWNLTAYDV